MEEFCQMVANRKFRIRFGKDRIIISLCLSRTLIILRDYIDIKNFIDKEMRNFYL